MFILKKGHQPGVYVPLRALFLVSSAAKLKSKLATEPATTELQPLERSVINVPLREKTRLRGFRTASTQTRLYNHTRSLEA